MPSSARHAASAEFLALTVVRPDARCRDGHVDLVFPSARGQVLPRGTLSKMLRDMRIGAVPYGFQHSFAEWAAEAQVHPKVAGMCLSHNVL